MKENKNLIDKILPEYSIGRKCWNWLDKRLHLDDLAGFLEHKKVPVGQHSMLWYYLGGVTLFLFIIQIITGILLLMYYQPGANTSYESIRHIVLKVPFGWLLRSIHCWSAHLMVLALIIHMFSVFFLKAYRSPRELTWFTGFGLFGVALAFGFSGYLLPWNELSFFATAVGTDSVKSVPFIGNWLLTVMRGGDEVTIRTLYRFFALHVCVLPFVTFGLIGLHIALIQRQGMAPLVGEPESGKESSGMPFFPNFALRDLLLWVIVLNVLSILAVTLPYGPGIPGFEWELGSKADAFKAAYPGIKPEWYFLWIYQLLKEFPPHFLGMEGPQACLVLVNILMGIWFFIPFIDRNGKQGKPSPVFTDFGVGVVYFILYLMFKAWDVGVVVPHGVDPNANPVTAAIIVENSTFLIMILATAVTAFRGIKLKHRFFYISLLPVLQAVLHAFLKLSYLASGGVALVLLVVILIVLNKKNLKLKKSSLGFFIILSLTIAVTLTQPLYAQEENKQDEWPSDFKELTLQENKGEKIITDKLLSTFRELPKHAQKMIFDAVEEGFLGTAEQLAMFLSLDIKDEQVELIMSDNCILCHTNDEIQDNGTLFRKRTDENDEYYHLNISEFISDVHFRRGLSCSGCHGGNPKDTEMSDEIFNRMPENEVRKTDKTWIPGFCADRCHSNPAFMREYNPSLPVDQMLKYRVSKHGELLLKKKDSKAAQCVSCHGVHGIRDPLSPKSKVYKKNIPFTCSRCHADKKYMKGYTLKDGKTPIPTNQIEMYRTSVHGKALFEKNDMGVPVCNTCHGNHAAMPADKAHIAQICRNCHVNNGNLFDGSPHKKVFEEHKWPECVACHGKHLIKKPDDEMLGNGSQSICNDCHSKFGKESCFKIAEHFRTEILSIIETRKKISDKINKLTESGVNAEDVQFELQSLNDAVISMRSIIHSFDKSTFDKSAKKGKKKAEELSRDLDKIEKEMQVRNTGIIFSTFIITLFAIILYLKIRQLDVVTGFKKDEK